MGILFYAATAPYEVPLGDEVNFSFGSGYSAPSGDSVDFVF